ncbi:MAG: sulfatase [Planctomycetes bacterium]|nr:sulfatase [Planctomycetota bacterium]
MTRARTLLGGLSAWSLCLLALLVALGAGVLRLLPVEDVLPRPTATLEAGSMRPELGFAYLYPVDALGLDLGESEAQGRSQAVLYEDGVPLRRNSYHQQIRDKGAGQFSHWQNVIYFASSDGGDPRTNGRRYEVVLPSPPDVLSAYAEITRWALWIGAGLALLTSVFARGRGVLVLRLAAVVAVAHAAHDAWQLTPWQHWHAWLDGMRSDLEVPAPGSAPDALALADDVPRTLRLLDETPDFVATGPAPTASEPILLRLHPEGDVDQRDGAYRLSAGDALRASLETPMSAGTLTELALRVRVLEGQTVRIAFEIDPPSSNGHLPEVQFPVNPGPDWQTFRIGHPLDLDYLGHTIAEDASATVVGVQLHTRADGGSTLLLEPDTLQLCDAYSVYTRATHGIDAIELRDSRRPSAWASTSGDHVIPLPRGTRGRLRGSVGAFGWGASGAPSASVLLVGPEGQHELHRVDVEPGQGWADFDVALPDDAGDGAHRVVLRGELGTATVLAWSGLRAVDTARPARRVLLLLVDTLRADAVGSLGGLDDPTPTLDDLASQGALFTHCYSQAYWTRPSMPSIMTGRYVRATGVSHGAVTLPDSYDTLAERFARAGFHTVGLLTNSQAGPASGLAQGLDELSLEPGLDDTRRFLVELVEPSLARLEDDDLFVWLHFMQVHGPYGPLARPDDWTPHADGMPVRVDPGLDRSWVDSPTVEDRIALYHADVRQLDHALGEFLGPRLAAWEQNGEPTVVALAADHGELLGEYGRWGHSWERLVPEEVHVPLILRAPGRIAAGIVWDGPVENIDLGETLLDAAGVVRWSAADDRADRGRTLLPLLDGRRAPSAHDAVALSETYWPGQQWGYFSAFSEEGALIGDDGALVGMLRPGDARYRSARHPDDLTEADRDPSAAFVALWRRLIDTQRLVREAHRAGGAEAEMDVDAASLEQMRALGYFGGGH